MPADITGTDVLQDDPETGRRQFVFLPGPIFANIILADEINRRDEELAIMKQTTSRYEAELEAVPSAEQILQMQNVVRQVVAADHIFDCAADLVRATRPGDPTAPKFIPNLVSWGAGPKKQKRRTENRSPHI